MLLQERFGDEAMREFFSGLFIVLMLMFIPYTMAWLMLMHLVPLLTMVIVWLVASLLITVGFYIYDKTV